MTSIDAGARDKFNLSDLEEKERENERLRAEVDEWRRKYESAKKRDIAFAYRGHASWRCPRVKE